MKMQKKTKRRGGRTAPIDKSSFLDRFNPGPGFLRHSDHLFRGGQRRLGKDVTERAYEMARHIVATHEPAPLPPGVDEQMTSIIEEYEKEISRGN